MLRSLRLLFLAIFGAASTTGCAVVGAVGAASVGMVGMQDRTFGQGLDDALASNTVKARLMAVDSVGYAHVDVEVAGGRLLLSGYAPSQQHVNTAELIARNVGGVNEVYNEIVVAENQGMMRSAQDELITAQIRTRIVASRNVRGLNANIETHNGTVYLMGVMRSEQELQRAAEIASVVPGVRRVVSLMTVRGQQPQVMTAGASSAPSASASSTSVGMPLTSAETAPASF